MFNFDIKLSKKSDNNRVILDLPKSLYVIFSIISLIVFITIMMFGGSVISYIVFVIAVIVLTYHEKWSFDRDKQSIEFNFGLGFISKTYRYTFEDIEMIEKVIFKKGELKKQKESNIFSLKIYVKSGNDHTILTYSKVKKDQFNIIVSEIENITGTKAQEI